MGDGSEAAVRPELRSRLALALDVDDMVLARRLSRELRPWFGVVKIGLELFCAAGPSVVQEMLDDGYRVFLDLKLADIPTTVYKTANVLATLGVSYLSMHAFPGATMLRAGVDGLTEGAAQAGLATPAALAVTILTSDSDAPPHILGKRVAVAAAAHCAGVVCAASDVKEAKLLSPSMLAVVPGIRPLGVPANDQLRSATPAEAFEAGADLLVIGRAVTGATDRRAAAESITSQLI